MGLICVNGDARLSFSSVLMAYCQRSKNVFAVINVNGRHQNEAMAVASSSQNMQVQFASNIMLHLCLLYAIEQLTLTTFNDNSRHKCVINCADCYLFIPALKRSQMYVCVASRKPMRMHAYFGFIQDHTSVYRFPISVFLALVLLVDIQ